MNAAINPLIYGFRTPIFRALVTKLCCLKPATIQTKSGYGSRPMLSSMQNSPLTVSRNMKENNNVNTSKFSLADSRTSSDDKTSAHPNETEKITVD